PEAVVAPTVAGSTRHDTATLHDARAHLNEFEIRCDAPRARTPVSIAGSHLTARICFPAIREAGHVSATRREGADAEPRHRGSIRDELRRHLGARDLESVVALHPRR